MLEIVKHDPKSPTKTIGELLKEFRESVERAGGETKEPTQKEEQSTPAEKKEFSDSAGSAEKKP